MLWRLTKSGRIAEARARMTPLGPELRILVEAQLVWSQVFRGTTAGAALGEQSDQSKRDFEGRGWHVCPEARFQ